MKVIVTGASGFIGKNLILRVPKTWETISIYNNTMEFPQFIKSRRFRHVIAARCDLTSESEIKALRKKFGNHFDLCIYLAANGDPALSSQNPLLDFRLNAFALANFLDAIKIKRFVFLSSGAVYDGLKGAVSPKKFVQPKLPYAISKFAAEQYIKFFTQKGQIDEYVILRFFGAYGPYEPPRKIFTKLIKMFYFDGRSQFVIRGNGKNLIDAMYIEDAIDGILKVVRSNKKNLTVDFCSGTPKTIDDLAKAAASVFGKRRVQIKHEGTVPEYIQFYASSREMGRLFDFRPRISLQEGLTKFAHFLTKVAS